MKMEEKVDGESKGLFEKAEQIFNLGYGVANIKVGFHKKTEKPFLLFANMETRHAVGEDLCGKDVPLNDIVIVTVNDEKALKVLEEAIAALKVYFEDIVLPNDTKKHL